MIKNNKGNMDFGIGGLVTALFILVPFAVFGVWKLVEVVIWLFKHVSILIK